MSIFSVADETRRQAREGKEKGVPARRDPLPPIEAETGRYIDLFVDGGSNGNNSGGDTKGDDGGDAGAGDTTTTQENDPNNTPSGGGGGGGVTFNPDDPSTWAEEGGAKTVSADDLDASTSAPEDSDSCIGCEVDKMDDITEGTCAEATGDCFKIHYDGVFPTPTGWDDPDTPPDDENWVVDEYWEVTGTGITANGRPEPSLLTSPTYQALFASWNAQMAGWAAGSQFDGWYTRPYQFNVTSAGAGLQAQNWRGKELFTGQTEWTLSTEMFGCPGSAYEGNDAVCPATVPPATETWPDDGCYDLAFDGLAFKGSDRDPNLPDKYKGDGTSSVDFCTTGGKDGATRTGADGGYQIDTTNMMRYYDSDGRLRAAGDKTQTFIDQYKP